MRLFYTVFERRLSPNAIQAILNKQKIDIPCNHGNAYSPVAKIPRHMPAGPDDVSPDLNLEKKRLLKHEKKKRGPKPKKKPKKLLDIDVDDSVKEAMSESEEQLAKLTLDCSGDTSRVNRNAIANGDTSDEIKTSHKPKTRLEVESDEVVPNEGTSSANEQMESESGKENLTVETDDTDKVSSAQTSPGSVTLAHFQPLNAVTSVNDNSENKFESLSEFKTAEQKVENSEPKKRGRKKGSKNKVKKVAENGDSIAESSTTVVEAQSVNNCKAVTPRKSSKTESEPANETKEKKTAKPSAKSKKGEDNTGGQVEKVKRKYVRKTKLESEPEGVKAAKRMKPSEQCDSLEKSKPDLGNSKDISEGTEREVKSKCANHDNTVEVSEEVKQSSETSETESAPKKVCDGNGSCGSSEGIKDKSDCEMSSGQGSLIEPVTPLYGETPKVSESNQGLPCSPNMNGFEVPKPNDNVKESEVDKTCDNEVVDKHNDKHDNGVESVECGNHNFIPAATSIVPVSTIAPGAFVGCSTSVTGLNVPTTHFMYGGGLPISVSRGSYLGAGFMSPVITAHPSFEHGLRPVYMHCESNIDQPLDLTNSVNKEQYTKGKIFKTKMLKKIGSKQEPFSPGRDKVGLQNCVDVYTE